MQRSLRPLGPSGFDFAQLGQTPRPSTERIRINGLLSFGSKNARGERLKGWLSSEVRIPKGTSPLIF
jgi:hypothetical protein